MNWFRNSQWYSLNIYLSTNKEDIVVFYFTNILNSDNFLILDQTNSLNARSLEITPIVLFSIHDKLSHK